ncbi:MAG: ABC transporter permease [Planctomycetota bacterium]|nr:ABC transporter permease [Planctomycetota bacterium]
MSAYIIRRLLYLVPTVLGVCLITFLLFNVVTTGEAIAKQRLGQHATQEQIESYLKTHGYDKPLLIRFFINLKDLLTFNFGRSEVTHQKITTMLWNGMWPSLSLMVPAFFFTLFVAISIALFTALYRNTFLDRSTVVLCIIGMSVPFLAYIILGQYILGYKLKYFPVTGYEWGLGVFKFLILPGLIYTAASLGSDVRFYRTVVLDEINQDYVRTARAKGLSPNTILFKHILKNAMIPIITRVVVALPFLYMGSLLLEDFYGIPGLGAMALNAIDGNDFAVIKAITFIGAILYVLANLAGDILYALVDPRVEFK